MKETGKEPEHVEPRIGLWDAVSIIIGIIIGVGIFRVPKDVFENVSSGWLALLVWGLGGLLALVGAFCFAELATTYPRSGGEYVYLTRAYGARVGLLYAWAQLTVIRPGSIAGVAYIFASSFGVWGAGSAGIVILAGGSIAVLSCINILGVTLSKHTQNLLTVLKILGLGAIAVAGFLWPKAQPESPPAAVSNPSFAQAMIFALWAYSGWHEASYVAAEVKNARRNLPLSLITGTAVVTLIYLLVNAAILAALGFAGARSTDLWAVAVVGQTARDAVTAAVMISALGAMNGMIFTTARIYAVFGEDHPLFGPLGHWSRRWGTPVTALIVQAVLSIALVVGVSLLWSKDTGAKDAFAILVDGTTPVFWLFFLFTGIALFILRRKDAGLVRPFRVPGYPFLPALFCVSCAYLVVGSILSADYSLIGFGILLAGLPLCILTRSGPKGAENAAPDVPQAVGPHV
jgi:basic amino acid/polyamine antiporter, APA family